MGGKLEAFVHVSIFQRHWNVHGQLVKEPHLSNTTGDLPRTIQTSIQDGEGGNQYLLQSLSIFPLHHYTVVRSGTTTGPT